MTTKYRLVTRSDFDGLVCAVLLKKLDMIDEIKFVHPKDMQDGKVPVSDRDITTNLPYCEGVHLAFDHHSSEVLRVGKRDNHIIDPHADSAARVVFRHYGGMESFADIPEEMMVAVDQADSARFSQDEILHPTDWVLLNYLMDARTGLGRFREFRISNYDLMMRLIDACLTMSVEEILAMPDVKERVDLYFEHETRFRDQIQRCAVGGIDQFRVRPVQRLHHDTRIDFQHFPAAVDADDIDRAEAHFDRSRRRYRNLDACGRTRLALIENDGLRARAEIVTPVQGAAPPRGRDLIERGLADIA